MILVDDMLTHSYQEHFPVASSEIGIATYCTKLALGFKLLVSGTRITGL